MGGGGKAVVHSRPGNHSLVLDQYILILYPISDQNAQMDAIKPVNTTADGQENLGR